MKAKIINGDFRLYDIPKGLTITDPPYNQNYHYAGYKDKLNENDYIDLLAKIPLPCVIIHYPEETINILPKAFNVKCEQVVSWVYNSNTGKQSRLISWWGCKPDFNKIKQPYKNENHKRIKFLMSKGKTGGKIYDWWEINQIKHGSNEKTKHPCQIPEEIIKRIIIITAKENDLIIDPFAGSGTMAKVANELNFNSLSFEIDSNYFEIIKQRIAQLIIGNNE